MEISPCLLLALILPSAFVVHASYSGEKLSFPGMLKDRMTSGKEASKVPRKNYQGYTMQRFKVSGKEDRARLRSLVNKEPGLQLFGPDGQSKKSVGEVKVLVAPKAKGVVERELKLQPVGKATDMGVRKG